MSVYVHPYYMPLLPMSYFKCFYHYTEYMFLYYIVNRNVISQLDIRLKYPNLLNILNYYYRSSDFTHIWSPTKVLYQCLHFCWLFMCK